MIGDGGNSFTVPDIALGATTEPTDLLPQGLSPDMVLEFTSRSTGAILPTPKSPDDVGQYPMHASKLAYFATVDPKVLLNHTRPAYPTFRIGKVLNATFQMPIRGNLRLQGYMFEFDIDRNSKIYEIATAPQDFKDAHEKALKQYGGGGVN